MLHMCVAPNFRPTCSVVAVAFSMGLQYYALYAVSDEFNMLLLQKLSSEAGLERAAVAGEAELVCWVLHNTAIAPDVAMRVACKAVLAGVLNVGEDIWRWLDATHQGSEGRGRT